MPTVEIPLANPGFGVHHFEPHRVVEAADFNQLSGDTFADSWLEQLVSVSRMMLGHAAAGPAYLGFRTLDFGGSGPATHIDTASGIAIANNGIWPVPAARLEPTPEAHFGHFEFSLEEGLADETSKRFYSIEREEFSGAMVPIAKRRFIRLYEKYNVSPEMTITTPGRIRWLEYRKEAAFQQIVSLKNWLTAGVSTDGFTTGDVKYSFMPGDGLKWLTCDGGEIPREFQDLINYFRSVSTHQEALPITEVADDGNGLCRIKLPPATNLKNVRTHPGPGYACLEIQTSDNVAGFPPGTYKIKAIAGNEITIALAFAGGSYTGTAIVRPYSIADEDGGGARTPLPSFLRPYNPAGDVNDLRRLPNTYQPGQIPEHDHGGTTSAGTPHNHTLTDPGHYHPYIDTVPEWPPIGDNYAVPTGGSGVQKYPHARTTSSASTGISILDESSHTHTFQKEGGEDLDNPADNRPANLSVYLLVKT